MTVQPTDLPGKQQLMATAVGMEGGLGVVAIALGWVLGFNPLELVVADWWAMLWGCLAALPIVGALLATERLPFWPFSDVANVVDRLIRPLFAGSTILELAVISALAGIGEELMFRGLIQEGLARWIGGAMGAWIALPAASILFGLLHPMNWAYVVLAAMIGLFLGGLWIATGNLLVPIVAHGLYDFFALVWLVRIEKPPQAGEAG